MPKKKLQELNLLDDFLFGKVMTYPGLGEEFCKKLIRIILGVELNHITIKPQKVLYGADTDLHGARLDVYIEENGNELEGTLYDFEPDKKDSLQLMKALPQRARLYHALMDQECLRAGQTYEHLKRVVVILVTPYDPFEQDHMVYSISNRCKEIPDMPYDDGAKTIFLYTKGKKGNPSTELKELLHYMEESTLQNACSTTLREIHAMVEQVKQDREVSLDYMKTSEWKQLLYEKGHDAGYTSGYSEGHESGYNEGHESGYSEGHDSGYNEGHESGYNEGHDSGYNEGTLQERERSIRLLIQNNREEGVSDERIMLKLQKNYQLSEEEARKYLEE